ncbi:MAG TPA: MmgE/PrpD family protein [Syntrophobacteria bacterium]|nr:MmgE/PrpD family protein [Syntrophobacteria bacterium]
MKIVDRLSHWASELGYDDLDRSAINACKSCVRDTCAVAIAGSEHTASKIIRQYVEDHLPTGSCTILGTKRKGGAAAAAFANSFSAHVWDFDDTCYAGIVHPSAVILPCILACGEQLGCSGKDLITAYIAGLEVQGKLGEAVSPDLFMKGWFTTSILGVIGAATAASKLCKLEPERIKSAIALGLCRAGGMRQNNGTAAKPYTAACAAETGVHAAVLAGIGISASGDILEGPEGFLQVYCDNKYDKGVFSRIGKPLVINEPGVALKPYPTCSGTHAAMEAAVAIMAENSLEWQDLTKVICRTTPVAVRSLKYNNPVSAEQAQFSMPYCIACILKMGKFDVGELSSGALDDKDIRRLMARVEMVTTDAFESYGRSSVECPEGCEVTIQTKDGGVHVRFVGHARGSPSAPFSIEDEWRKFSICTRDIIDDESGKKCFERISDLENLDDIRELTGFMVGS